MGNILSTKKGVYDLDTIRGAYEYLAERLGRYGAPGGDFACLALLYREAKGTESRLVKQLQQFQKDLDEQATNQYVAYSRQMSADEALGFKQLVKTKKFKRKNLKAHTNASEHFGQHVMAVSVVKRLDALLGQVNQETPDGPD